MRWQLSTPARVELIGPSHCGKSTLALKLVGDDSVWDRPFRKVVYAAPLLNDREDYLEQLRTACGTRKDLLVVEHLPSVEEVQTFADQQPVLLVVDDLLGFEDARPLKDLVTIHSHHRAISCLFCVQNPFLRTAKLDLTTLSRNLTARFLFYQTNDFQVYATLNSRLFPERKQFLLGCLEVARTRYQLPYICINTSSFTDLPRRYICMTSLFEDERVKTGGSPVFFDLQKQGQ